MDVIKKKVLRDVFTSPWTLAPVVAGVGALAAYWGLDGSAWLAVAGAGGLLGGAGTALSRLFFRADKLTERAYRSLQDQQKREREAALDQLERQLASVPDPRTEDCFRQLRRLYAGFQEDVAAGRITGQTHQVTNQVEQVFEASVAQLRTTFELWKSAQSLRGEAKEAMLVQREQVIQDVIATLGHLARTIEQFHTFQVQRKSSELDRLRAELDETLLVARRTEQRMAELDKTKNYEASDFESQE